MSITPKYIGVRMDLITTAIPIEEKKVKDDDVFLALDLDYSGLEKVKEAYQNGDIVRAKSFLIDYFRTRTNVKSFFDYRSLPLKKIDLLNIPYWVQSLKGTSENINEYIEYAAKELLQNNYVLPNGNSLFLGENLENFPHASRDEIQKVQQGMNIRIKRGHFFEVLAIYYHQTGDERVLYKFQELLSKFFEEYNLIIEETSEKSAWFQYSENRESMDVGWLILTFINLLNLNILYHEEMDQDLVFQLIKRLWFFSIQFRRYDKDSFSPHNHHFFERGIVPYITSKLLPEFKDLRSMEQRGKDVINEHLEKDFTDTGSYSEHSLAYFFGATVNEMLLRCMVVAQNQKDHFISENNLRKIEKIFDIAAYISAPGKYYPAIGDGGGPKIDDVLKSGMILGNKASKEVFEIRQGLKEINNSSLDLHFCSNEAGFIAGRDGYGKEANYFLMSCKKDCPQSSHDHMDMLSVNIAVKGNMIFDESMANDLYSKFIMGKQHRGFMYNMSSHNTVLAHSNPIFGDEFFSNEWGIYKPDTIIDTFDIEDKDIYVKAHHNGYGYCSVQRELKFICNTGFLIRDSVLLGTRKDIPHIQRWFLSQGVAYSKLADNMYLFQNGDSKLLCVWNSEELEVNFWKPDFLIPDIYEDSSHYNFVMDVKFVDKRQKKLKTSSTSMIDVLMLDVSNLTDVSEFDLDQVMDKIYNTGINHYEIINTLKNMPGKGTC